MRSLFNMANGYMLKFQRGESLIIFHPVDPISPNSVQQQFSPNDIHTLS